MEELYNCFYEKPNLLFGLFKQYDMVVISAKNKDDAEKKFKQMFPERKFVNAKKKGNEIFG